MAWKVEKGEKKPSAVGSAWWLLGGWSRGSMMGTNRFALAAGTRRGANRMGTRARTMDSSRVLACILEGTRTGSAFGSGGDGAMFPQQLLV
jgi:hypothetical protein